MLQELWDKMYMMEFLNDEIEFSTKANSMINPLSPKHGHVYIGGSGLEFRSESGQGYIQIPWTSIVNVQVQLFLRGRYVRGFQIETDENQLFDFVVHNAKEALKYMRKHLGRERFKANSGYLNGLFGNKKE